MKIHIDYRAEVPDEIIETDFCSTRDRKKCKGITSDLFEFPMYCNRFSERLEFDLGRYRKCEACKKACAEALEKRKASKLSSTE